MRFLASGCKLDDKILKELWMDCLPVNKVPFLINSPYQDDLDKLAEVADRIHNFHERPGINGIKTPAPAIITTQQPDVVTPRLEKLELLVITISSCYGKRPPTPPKRLHSPSKPQKCQLGCNYPRIGSFIPKLNLNRHEISIIPLNTIKGQDLDIAEPIKPNSKQSSTMFNPVKEFDNEMLPNDTRELSKELPDLANQQYLSKSVTQHRSPKRKILL
nr:hypothetical transcript [Hymenolepis microstoma]